MLALLFEAAARLVNAAQTTRSLGVVSFLATLAANAIDVASSLKRRTAMPSAIPRGQIMSECFL